MRSGFDIKLYGYNDKIVQLYNCHCNCHVNKEIYSLLVTESYTGDNVLREGHTKLQINCVETGLRKAITETLGLRSSADAMVKEIFRMKNRAGKYETESTGQNR